MIAWDTGYQGVSWFASYSAKFPLENTTRFKNGTLWWLDIALL